MLNKPKRPVAKRYDLASVDKPEEEATRRQLRQRNTFKRAVAVAEAETNPKKRLALFRKADAALAEYMHTTVEDLAIQRATGQLAEAVKALALRDRSSLEADIAHWRRALRVEDPYLDGLEVFWCRAKDEVAIIDAGGAAGQYDIHVAAYRREIATREAYLKALRELSLKAQFQERPAPAKRKRAAAKPKPKPKLGLRVRKVKP